MEELLNKMNSSVQRHAQGIRVETPVPNLSMGVLRQPTIPTMVFCEPMVCFVLQGAKQVLIGGSLLRYDAATCFASAIEMPATGCVLEASEDRPYVAVGLALNREALAALIAEMPALPTRTSGHGFGVNKVSAALLEALGSMTALLDRPDDIAALSAGREREVLYQLLQSQHGPMLRQITRAESRLSRIRRAIDWIRQHFDRQLRVEMLAELAGMSIPSFHRNFKSATAVSPLQYQKVLRLHAARRQLLTDANATQAAFSVGYESASQFSREYSRLFGIAPSRDAARLRGDLIPVQSVFI